MKLLRLCYRLSKIPITTIDPSLLHRHFRIILSGTANDKFLNLFLIALTLNLFIKSKRIVVFTTFLRRRILARTFPRMKSFHFENHLPWYKISYIYTEGFHLLSNYKLYYKCPCSIACENRINFLSVYLSCILWPC